MSRAEISRFAPRFLLLLTRLSELWVHLWIELEISVWNAMNIATVTGVNLLHLISRQIKLHVVVHST